jgi:cobalt-zinc-cadmium resistance protein CzcA
MHNPIAVAIVAFGTLAASIILVPRLGSEFLPELNEGALYVTVTLPGNMSPSEGRMLAPKVKSLLRRTPEVETMITQLGRPEDGTDATLPNNLEVFVKLKPISAWRKEKSELNKLVAEMASNLATIPGLEYNFSQPIRDNVAENISGQFGQIALKIYGDDMAELQKASDAAKSTISEVPGVADLGVVKSGESPQVTIRLDRAALARFDLDMEEVQATIETSMAGHVASELWEGEKRFDITVRLPKVTRQDVQAIRDIRLPLKSGTLIPLSAVADVRMSTGRAAITRENGHRYVGVRMNVRDRDMGSFVEEARQKVEAAVKLPAGYQMTWGGEFENQQRAMQRLRVVIPLALLITFFLLFSAFSSLLDATVILLHVPFALVGGIAGLAAIGMTLSVSAAVGFIALLGQAVLNGVLVVAAIRARLDAGQALLQAVMQGAEDRLRAVLMTALLASLGLLPAAMSHAMGSETQRPIAVVVVAGTVSAALLTLVVLPVSYYWVTKLRMALEQRRLERSALAPQTHP